MEFYYLVYLYLFIVGLCLGSFSSAVAYRVCINKSWVLGNFRNGAWAARSACPNCGHILDIVSLIPLFSWVFLDGKCRFCCSKISASYPLVELGGGALMIMLYCSIGMGILYFLYILTLPFFLAVMLLLVVHRRCVTNIPLYLIIIFFINSSILTYALLQE